MFRRLLVGAAAIAALAAAGAAPAHPRGDSTPYGYYDPNFYYGPVYRGGADGRSDPRFYSPTRAYAYGDYRWRVGDRWPYDYRSFLVTDPYAYSLTPAPYGFAWVLYGPDFLMIDLSSGRVAQVISPSW